MAKSRSYSIIYPLSVKNVRRNASKLGLHIDRLKRELEEVKKLRTTLQAACRHTNQNRLFTISCLDCGCILNP